MMFQEEDRQLPRSSGRTAIREMGPSLVWKALTVCGEEFGFYDKCIIRVMQVNDIM